MNRRTLTEAELAALTAVLMGNVPCDDLPPRQTTDVWGDIIPGKRTFVALEKLGLILFTEEEPIMLDGWSEPFTFTAYIEMTEQGRVALQTGFIDMPDPDEQAGAALSS